MKKKYIQLPKGYLSYSQIQLWKNDPARYTAIYMDGRDELRTTNSGQEYGKMVADSMEHDRETGDLLTDSATLLVPKYDLRDQEVRTELKTKYGWLSIVFKPDSRDSKTHAFRETKTGKNPWTASKAQKHPQMRFYAMGIYLAFKTLLKEAWLDYIETELIQPDNQSQLIIRPTGRVESFRVVFTLNDILKEMAETVRVAREIETAWVTHATKKPIGFYD